MFFFFFCRVWQLLYPFSTGRCAPTPQLVCRRLDCYSRTIIVCRLSGRLSPERLFLLRNTLIRILTIDPRTTMKTILLVDILYWHTFRMSFTVCAIVLLSSTATLLRLWTVFKRLYDVIMISRYHWISRLDDPVLEWIFWRT